MLFPCSSSSRAAGGACSQPHHRGAGRRDLRPAAAALHRRGDRRGPADARDDRLDIEVLSDEKAHTAIGFFERHAVEVERVLTDNGSAYRSAAHAIACRALGIRHLRTRRLGLWRDLPQLGGADRGP